MLGNTDQSNSKQPHTQQVKDSMSKHSKNYRQNELKIRRIEATSDRLTGRSGLALVVTYLHGIEIFDWFDRWFGSIRKSRKGLPITELFKQVLCFFVDGTSRRLTYFDQLREDEGYAGGIETDRVDMASSPSRSERFFKAFAWTRVFLFRRLLQTLFPLALADRPARGCRVGYRYQWSWTTTMPCAAMVSNRPTKRKRDSNPCR